MRQSGRSESDAGRLGISNSSQSQRQSDNECFDPGPAPRGRTPADLDAIAEHLGLSTKTVRRLIASGELVACRIRRAVRVAEDDLKIFLIQRRG